MQNAKLENLHYIEPEQVTWLQEALYSKLNGLWCPRCKRWHIPLEILAPQISGTVFGTRITAQVICGNCGYVDSVTRIY